MSGRAPKQRGKCERETVAVNPVAGEMHREAQSLEGAQQRDANWRCCSFRRLLLCTPRPKPKPIEKPTNARQCVIPGHMISGTIQNTGQLDENMQGNRKHESQAEVYRQTGT